MASIPAQLQADNVMPSRFELNITELSPAQRFTKAAIVGTSMLIITGLSVLIPLLHFILPPIFLALGIWLTVRAARIKRMIGESEGVCPACQAKFRIFPRALALPFRDVCEGCRREVLVVGIS